MTDEEAQAMLEELKKHYKEPVLPLSRFCDAITTWFGCIIRLCEKEAKTIGGAPWRSQGHGYYMHLRKISIDIRKSNLLYRLLYLGEEFREEECPKHGGESNSDRLCECQGTGWVHKPGPRRSQWERIGD